MLACAEEVVAHYHSMGAFKVPPVDATKIRNRIERPRRRCQVILCRRFAQDRAFFGTWTVARCLSEYAEVVLATDPNRLRRAIAAPFRPGRVVTRAYPPDWEGPFSRDLQRSDIAVLDASRPSEHVAWELSRCLEHLEPHRILMVARADMLPREMNGIEQDALKRSILSRLEASHSFGTGRFATLSCYRKGRGGRRFLADQIRRFMTRLVVAEALGLPLPPDVGR